MLERDHMHRVMLLVSSLGARIFRNNVGLAWMGKTKWHNQGTICIEGAQPVRYGLTVGSSDLIGWVPTTITQEMVGMRVAIFLAIETKGKRGKPTKEQMSFLSAVAKDGGIAIVSRESTDDIGRILEQVRQGNNIGHGLVHGQVPRP